MRVFLYPLLNKHAGEPAESAMMPTRQGFQRFILCLKTYVL